MQISWLGLSCFRLQGKNAVVLIDPFTSDSGLKLGKQNADIVLISHEHTNHNNRETGGTPLFFSTPGEYESKDVFVYGIPSFHDKNNGKDKGENVIFRIEMEGISIGHLGDLGHPLTTEEMEKLSGIDILMVPVGGSDHTINYKEAAEIVNELEPRIIIPMHYNMPGLKTKLDGVEKFAKEMAVSAAPETDKIKVTRKDLPEEKSKVIILSQS